MDARHPPSILSLAGRYVCNTFSAPRDGEYEDRAIYTLAIKVSQAAPLSYSGGLIERRKGGTKKKNNKELLPLCTHAGPDYDWLLGSNFIHDVKLTRRMQIRIEPLLLLLPLTLEIDFSPFSFFFFMDRGKTYSQD